MFVGGPLTAKLRWPVEVWVHETMQRAPNAQRCGPQKASSKRFAITFANRNRFR